MEFYGLLSEYYDAIFPVTTAEESFLAELLPPARPLRVLDLGCGTGGHSLFLAGIGHAVTGLDLESSMVERATEKAKALFTSEPPGSRVSFVVGDIVNLPFADATFDACICLGNTLAHLAGKALVEKAVGEMARVLVPNGLACVQVVNFDRVLAQGSVELPVITVSNPPLTFRRTYESSGDHPDGLRRVCFSSTLELSGAEPLSARVDMVALTADALKTAALKAGFDIAGLWGSFGKATFIADSPSTVAIFRRKE